MIIVITVTFYSIPVIAYLKLKLAKLIPIFLFIVVSEVKKTQSLAHNTYRNTTENSSIVYIFVLQAKSVQVIITIKMSELSLFFLSFNV